MTRRTKALRIGQSQVDRLEAEIDAINEELEPLTSFRPCREERRLRPIFTWPEPIVRRAERLATALMETESINQSTVIYLNRLSDHLFVLARQQNDGGVSDVLWIPGANL